MGSGVVRVFLEEDDGFVLGDRLLACFPLAFEMAEQQGGAEIVRHL
ncbi:MAG: hypothetical protein ACI9VS_004300, partial [Candidatus Binatia bacterium]